jgi:hypothetical protein
MQTSNCPLPLDDRQSVPVQTKSPAVNSRIWENLSAPEWQAAARDKCRLSFARYPLRLSLSCAVSAASTVPLASTATP